MGHYYDSALAHRDRGDQNARSIHPVDVARWRSHRHVYDKPHPSLPSDQDPSRKLCSSARTPLTPVHIIDRIVGFIRGYKGHRDPVKQKKASK
jgi:hypothetical protein